MGTQHKTASLHSTSVHLSPSTTSSMPSTPPSLPIAGITDMEEAVDAIGSTSKISPPTMSADIGATSPQMLSDYPLAKFPTTTSRSSSLPSKLPVVVVPEFTVPAHAIPEQINCPGGCKDYRCQLCDFSIQIKIVC